MHSIEIPELDQTGYTRFNETMASTIPQWNTRDISTVWILTIRWRVQWKTLNESNLSTWNTLSKNIVMRKVFYILHKVGVGLIQDQS